MLDSMLSGVGIRKITPCDIKEPSSKLNVNRVGSAGAADRVAKWLVHTLSCLCPSFRRGECRSSAPTPWAASSFGANATPPRSGQTSQVCPLPHRRGLASKMASRAATGSFEIGSKDSDGPVEAFLGKQRHIATESYGKISPLNLDEYECHGGFDALRRVFDAADPGRTIDDLILSGLRGRGGAGFPTGKKWAVVRDAKESPKYVVMNGDEGDPGAFMDRKLLESFPFRIIEGMIIAAYTVGASEGELYIRQEYPLALLRAKQALELLYCRGYLGENILGAGFDLELRVMEGAGAFVCGEETALLMSIEGNRGTPRTRPPYPAEKG
ncbi:MAG: hypothetical protein JW808_07815, partial [Victivallales bacterium]|nr:hypothetical protein [Victivallales bacterium]